MQQLKVSNNIPSPPHPPIINSANITQQRRSEERKKKEEGGLIYYYYYFIINKKYIWFILIKNLPTHVISFLSDRIHTHSFIQAITNQAQRDSLYYSHCFQAHRPFKYHLANCQYQYGVCCHRCETSCWKDTPGKVGAPCLRYAGTFPVCDQWVSQYFGGYFDYGKCVESVEGPRCRY